MEYRDDNSHLTERGLSTFAKQSWWRSKNMVDPGEDYLPLPEELLPRFHVPDGGEAVGIRSGETFIGAYQLLPDREPDAVWLGWYWLDPAFRGTGRGIAPMGQIIRAGRHRGVGLPASFLRRREAAAVFRPSGLLPPERRCDGKGHPPAAAAHSPGVPSLKGAVP